MNRYKRNSFIRFILVGSLLTLAIGCSKKPSQEQVGQLEEAKMAAESAERKLADLRQERAKLEAELQTKQSELQTTEKERDELKNKMGN